MAPKFVVWHFDVETDDGEPVARELETLAEARAIAEARAAASDGECGPVIVYAVGKYETATRALLAEVCRV